jgi:hypothetical protein
LAESNFTKIKRQTANHLSASQRQPAPASVSQRQPQTAEYNSNFVKNFQRFAKIPGVAHLRGYKA